MNHDRDQARDAIEVADRKAEEAAAMESQEAADAAEAAQAARQEARAAAARAERRLRTDLVKQMQGSNH